MPSIRAQCLSSISLCRCKLRPWASSRRSSASRAVRNTLMHVTLAPGSVASIRLTSAAIALASHLASGARSTAAITICARANCPATLVRRRGRASRERNQRVTTKPIRSRWRRSARRVSTTSDVCCRFEGKLRCARVAFGGVDFEATHDDFLQPGRNIIVPPAWWLWIAPQPAAPFRLALWLSEWPFAGREEIEDDAQGKDVATGITAIAEHLFRRDVGACTDRAFEFLGDQIGKLVM